MFVDNLFLQVVNEQVYLTFGQMQIPVTTEPEELSAVEIRPMARLIVPPSALRKMAKVVNTSLKDLDKRESK